MQKIMLSILTLAMSLQVSHANTEDGLIENSPEEVEVVSIEQQNIINLMQNNLQFESEKLNIENQITLAKLKKELREVNELLNEPSTIEQTVSREPVNEAYEQNINELMDAPVKPADKPKVVMVSHVAGTKKIGVINSENNRVSFVSENTPFKMNGSSYRVVFRNEQYRVVD